MLRKKLSISLGKKIILYIGLLDERKGADVFLQSIPRVVKDCQEAIFVFVSSPVHKGILYQHDEAKKKYQSCLDVAGEDLIFLEGKQDIPALMKLADVFVYPISTMHGILSLPLTLLEAVITAKAIISTNIPPMSDIFVNEENALLVAPRDIEACSLAIIKLLRNPLMIAKLSNNVKKLSDRYDLSKCSEDLVCEYSSFFS